MTIYIIKNEQKEEVAAYTVYEQARQLSEYFQSSTFQQYSLEALEVEVVNDVSA